MKKLRTIIKIDEEKCDGCGQCVPACVEGALQIVDGKARLVSEQYCDGLGACLGECPQGAITIEERIAEQFDEAAVERHVAEQAADQASQDPAAAPAAGCPGVAAFTLNQPPADERAAACQEDQPSSSRLCNWPVQLSLVPEQAPYFQGARLLIAADCVPFAYPDFHERFLTSRVLVVGCPKLDDAQFYRQKLAQIFTANDIRSVDILHMEVPCCFGLVRLVELALEDSGKQIPVSVTKVGVRGEVLETTQLSDQEAKGHAEMPGAGYPVLEA